MISRICNGYTALDKASLMSIFFIVKFYLALSK